MKRVLSILFILIMALAQHSYASENTEINQQNSAADALYDLGVMQGDENGNLNGEKLLTRAEFAALTVRIMQEETIGTTTRFSDVGVNHWAASYIGFMAEKGIIEGYGDGRFAPDEGVTLAQAAKILLSVTGYAETQFSFPYDYMICAAQKGLTVGVNIPSDACLTREEAAMLLINALHTPKNDGSGMLIEKNEHRTYYVSPSGDDSADGSYLRPWKTLKKAAESVRGNAIVFLNGGTYCENEKIIFSHSGEGVEKPLLVRTMPLCKAVIKATEILIDNGAENIAFKGLYFTQSEAIKEEENEEKEKSIILCKGNGFSFINNLSAVNDTVLKTENAVNITIENNSFTEGKCAVLLQGGDDIYIKNNSFEGQTEVSVIASGASKVKIYNNRMVADEKLTDALVRFEADSEGNNVCDSVIWNNILDARQGKTEAAGVILNGAQNCFFYNNIADSVNGALRFEGKNAGITSKNNIFMECSDSAYQITDAPSRFNSDNNCFYLSYPEIEEKNSKYINPYFVSRGRDWRLTFDSSAASLGVPLPSEIICLNGDVMQLDMRDADAKARSEKWLVGIYADTALDYGVNSGDNESDAEEIILLKMDFAKKADSMLTVGGDWKVSDGRFTQNSEEQSRSSAAYTLGEKWTDYEYSADVETPNTTKHASGILFRADLGMANMYAFRFLADSTIEFAKWQNGSFASVEKWDYEFTADAMYNLKVRAVGNQFTFYVNGTEIATVQDPTFASGTVGLYCHMEKNQYDNLKVVQAN